MALILLADDDELVGEVVREALSARGHVVGIVGNGIDAVKVVEMKRPALVILDCAMPEMNGIEALRQIRLLPNAHRTPVLMLTGRRSEMDVEIAVRAGANDYLKKPFDADQLIAHVEHLLDKARAGSATVGSMSA
jgi:DNA-binding response OmpR family regulator